jgi:hypothetical protein
MTICGWEGNATVPEVRYTPAIVQFLGYNPLPALNSLAERLAGAQGARPVAAENGRKARRRSGDTDGLGSLAA